MAKLNVTSKDGLDRFLSKAKQSDTYIAGILNPAAADSEESKNKKIFILCSTEECCWLCILPLPSLPQQQQATRPLFPQASPPQGISKEKVVKRFRMKSSSTSKVINMIRND